MRQEPVTAKGDAQRWRQTAKECGIALAQGELALGEQRIVLQREQKRGNRLEAELRDVHEWSW